MGGSVWARGLEGALADGARVQHVRSLCGRTADAFPRRRRHDQTCSLQANHTFVFVDKLRTLSETLLGLARRAQSGGHGQMLGRLQVSVPLAEGQGAGAGRGVRGRVCRGLSAALPAAW